jgi:hypothetical protein
MAKSGQHHNSGTNPSQPRGHEKSFGKNHPDRSQEITTGPYKKKETYRKQAAEHSSGTTDAGRGASNREPWNEDIRDEPTNTGSTRERHPHVE